MMARSNIKGRRQTLFLAASALAFGVAPTAAIAQEQPPATQDPPAVTIDDVVVTAASRINRSGYTAPTPLTVISGEELKSRALVSLADSLNEAPSFSGSSTPSTTATDSQLTGGNYLNLRGLGTGRTLVLLNGRRHVPTDTSGASVDLNVIPASLVERVEVITGGASAAWGSDAVAGVVNISLKRRIEGFEGDVQFGRSERGDNNEVRTSLAWGTSFADGRGDIVVAGELVQSDGVPRQSHRDWAREYGIIANPAYAPGNGEFRQLIVPDARFSIMSTGGVIVSGPLRGTQFLAGGTPAAFQYGDYVGAYMSGGDGAYLGAAIPLKTPLDRKNLYISSNFDITDSLRAFFEASYANSQASNDLVPTYSLGDTIIRLDNAFIPASTRDAMVAHGLQTIAIGRADFDMPFIRPESDQTTQRFVVGLAGELKNWQWEGSYQYGRNHYTSTLRGNRIVANYEDAVDAVLDPSTGRIVCRSALSNPASTCVPMNIFGAGSPSAESIAYTTADQVVDSRLTEQTLEFSAQGDLYQLPAGPLTLAVGGLYRKDELDLTVDDLSAASAFLIGNPKANAGEITAKEVFGEVVAPLLVDLPWVRRLEFNGAARLTDYSTSGAVTTWKAGLSYEVNDEFRFRATRSRDVRAPNLSELYATDVLQFDTVLQQETNQQVTARILTTGNASLVPEEADTTTFGIVYQPRWTSGLRASVDYYDIQIEGVISTLSSQTVVDRCFAGAQFLCDLITRDSDGQISEIRFSPLNLAGLSTKGVDVEASYSTDLSEFTRLPGTASLRVLATYVGEQITDDGVTAIDRAGDVGSDHGGVPQWRLNATATYVNGPLSLTLNGRYIGDGKYDNTYGAFDINDNTVPSRTYVNASVRFTIVDGDRGQVEVYGAVSNVFDQDPPVNVLNFALPNTTNFGLYELIGRSYTAGLRFKF